MRKRLRIAFVAACPFPCPRGTPVRILRLAETVAGRGHEVHVVTYHLGAGKVPEGLLIHRIRDLSFYRKLSPGPSYAKIFCADPLLVFLMRQILAEKAFDVIHAHHYEGLLAGAMARGRKKIPLIYDAHTMLDTELPAYGLGLPDPLKKYLGRKIDSWVPRLADHVICVTDKIRRRLESVTGMTPSRFSVISNGVEFEHFNAVPVNDPEMDRSKTVMFTGNLARYQGIDLLLESFRAVAKKIQGVRLVIATDSAFAPYEPFARMLGIRDMIEILPSPDFCDLPGLLARADVVVIPRPGCDGIPLKLLNYMAAGKPVVSFAASAPGIVHEQTGWIAEDGNAAALAEGIIALLEDGALARNIGLAGRHEALKNHCWEINALQCEEIYYRTLKR